VEEEEEEEEEEKEKEEEKEEEGKEAYSYYSYYSFIKFIYSFACVGGWEVKRGDTKRPSTYLFKGGIEAAAKGESRGRDAKAGIQGGPQRKKERGEEAKKKKKKKKKEKGERRNRCMRTKR